MRRARCNATPPVLTRKVIRRPSPARPREIEGAMRDSQSQPDASSSVAGRHSVLAAVVTLIACVLTARNASAQGGLPPAILTPAQALARYPAGTVFVIVFDPRAGTSVLIPAADMPRGG